MADVTERLLTLLAALQTGRAFTGEELAVRLAVSTRTVRRDMDRLRGYGYPVDAQPGPGGRYRLAAGATVPPLVFDDDEAVAALVGLALLAADASHGAGSLDDAATRAYGKLDHLLPARLRGGAADLRASLELRVPNAPSVAVGVMAALAAAVAERRVVRFDYRDQRSRATERRVEPHRQVFLRQRWYLLGWDLDRGDWRVFRLDRIAALMPTTARFAPRPLPADTAVDYLRQGMNVPRPVTRLRVHASPAAVRDAFKDHDTSIVEDAGEVVVEVRVDHWPWLLPLLARLDADFRFDDVPEREGIAAFADRLRAATREPVDRSDR